MGAVETLTKLANKNNSSQVNLEKIGNLLNHREVHVRCAATVVLGSFKAKSFVKRIAPLLEDDAEDESWLPMQVGKAELRPKAELRKPLCAALYALGMMGSKANADKAVCFLTDTNWEVRLAAVDALKKMGEIAREHTGKLVEALDDEIYVVRAATCFAIAELELEDHARDISNLLTDPAEDVRSAAAASLGLMGEAGRAFSSEIFELVNDFSSHVRIAAIEALVQLDEQVYAGVIAQMMEDADVFVCVCVIDALGNLGEHGSAFAEDVARFLKHDIPQVRAAAARSLGRMGQAAAPFHNQVMLLLGDVHPDVGDAAVGALDRMVA